MTLTSTSSRMAPYAGNGAATAFPITFPFLDDTHIRAILERPGEDDADLVLDTDYTLAGAGEATGGTLAFPKAGSAYHVLAEGESLHILRQVPLTQEQSWDNVDAIDAGRIEAGSDRLTMIAQQLQEQLDRCVQWPATAAGGAVEPADMLQDIADAQAVSTAASAAAQTARDAALAARDQAAAAAAGLNLPGIAAGDAGKLLQVRADAGGYQLLAPTAEATAATASTIAKRDADGAITATAFIGTVRYA